mgnify:CR=1 FL=1
MGIVRAPSWRAYGAADESAARSYRAADESAARRSVIPSPLLFIDLIQYQYIYAAPSTCSTASGYFVLGGDVLDHDARELRPMADHLGLEALARARVKALVRGLGLGLGLGVRVGVRARVRVRGLGLGLGLGLGG